jgi:predicted transcriptional regulator
MVHGVAVELGNCVSRFIRQAYSLSSRAKCADSMKNEGMQRLARRRRSSRKVAQEYFDAWRDRDFSRLRETLDDHVTFSGPLGHYETADSYIRGLRSLSDSIADVVVQKIFVDGQDVTTWFDIYVRGSPPYLTANWTHVQDGKITRVLVAVDPRPFLNDDGEG